jgi:hypothetical protein
MRSRFCPCVCIPLSLIGNDSAKIPPIVVRQRLGKNSLIVARQRLGKKPLIFARQRLGKSPPILARQPLGRNNSAVTNKHANCWTRRFQ